MPNSPGYILEISSKRATAIIAIDKTKKIEVIECTNVSRCRIQGIILTGTCPHFCPFVVDAKRYIDGLRTRNRVEILRKSI